MIAAQEIAASLGSMLRGQRGTARRFRHAVVDSRKAAHGDLFVALAGDRTDGHRFVADAVQRGARGVLDSQETEGLPDDVAVFLVDDPLAALQRLAAGRRERRSAKVVGITGSVGKTTTKEITASVLETKYRVLKNEANYNSEIGLPITMLELTHKHQRAVLEMGMWAQGEIRTLCEIARPEIGVVTNVGPAHLERLGSMEAIAAAKSELPESLPSHGFAIFNADDPLVMAMTPRTKARPVTYGLSDGSDVQATNVESAGLEGVSFTIRWQGGESRAETSLPGRHIVSNALAAAAVGLTDGMTLDEVASALSHAEPPLRVRTFRTAAGGLLIDDTYNASPASMAAALDLLGEIPGRRTALLGDMRELGAAEVEEHRVVGQLAAETATVIHAVGELGELIAEGARAEGHRDTHHWPDKAAALEAVRADMRPDDVLLVKASRAMEFETLVEELRAGNG